MINSRKSKSQKNRAKSRNIESFIKMVTKTETATVTEILQGESTVAEALDLVNELRVSDPFPNRTLGVLKRAFTYGQPCDPLEMGRAIRRLKGAIETVQQSEVLNKSEQQILISGLTGVGTTRAFRESCK